MAIIDKFYANIKKQEEKRSYILNGNRYEDCVLILWN